MTRYTRPDWLERARTMAQGDIIALGTMSMTRVRDGLNSLRADPDPIVAAKRYRVKRVPDPVDRADLKGLKSGKYKAEDVEILLPNGRIFVCCGECWPDLRGFPRTARGSGAKWDSLLVSGPENASPPAPQPRYEPRPAVRQEDVPQAFPDYEGQSQAYRRR